LHEARQYGVSHGLRDGVHRGRQHLTHEERVAAGHLIDGVRIALRALRELFNSAERKGGYVNASRMLSSEFPEDAAQEVRRGEFIVTIGSD
jgi:hypothetical protein